MSSFSDDDDVEFLSAVNRVSALKQQHQEETEKENLQPDAQGFAGGVG